MLSIVEPDSFIVMRADAMYATGHPCMIDGTMSHDYIGDKCRRCGDIFIDAQIAAGKEQS